MMVKDYHMHPQIVGKNLFHEFAEAAIAKGIEEVCITDHTVSSITCWPDKISDGMLEEYCKKGRQLAGEYEGRLSVKLGIEMDYVPFITDEIEEILKIGKFDYVLGSIHSIPSLFPGYFDGSRTFTEFAAAYLENAIKAAQSGYFTAIAHMDMYRCNSFYLPQRYHFEPDGFTYERCMPLIEKLLDTVRDQGIFLEINPHFAERVGDIEQTYPEPPIMKMALDRGIQFTYGSDAHAVSSVGAYLNELREHPIYGAGIREFEARS